MNKDNDLLYLIEVLPQFKKFNGDLIWVDDYTRHDGTPVKGYYRRK